MSAAGKASDDTGLVPAAEAGPGDKTISFRVDELISHLDPDGSGQVPVRKLKDFMEMVSASSGVMIAAAGDEENSRTQLKDESLASCRDNIVPVPTAAAAAAVPSSAAANELYPPVPTNIANVDDVDMHGKAAPEPTAPSPLYPPAPGVYPIPNSGISNCFEKQCFTGAAVNELCPPVHTNIVDIVDEDVQMKKAPAAPVPVVLSIPEETGMGSKKIMSENSASEATGQCGNDTNMNLEHGGEDEELDSNPSTLEVDGSTLLITPCANMDLGHEGEEEELGSDPSTLGVHGSTTISPITPGADELISMQEDVDEEAPSENQYSDYQDGANPLNASVRPNIGQVGIGNSSTPHIPEAILVEDGDDEVFLATIAAPWQKQKRTRLLICSICILVVIAAVVFGTSYQATVIAPTVADTFSPSFSFAPSSSPTSCVLQISSSAEIVDLQLSLSDTSGLKFVVDGRNMIVTTHDPKLLTTYVIFYLFDGDKWNMVNAFREDFFLGETWTLSLSGKTSFLGLPSERDGTIEIYEQNRFGFWAKSDAPLTGYHGFGWSVDLSRDLACVVTRDNLVYIVRHNGKRWVKMKRVSIDAVHECSIRGNTIATSSITNGLQLYEYDRDSNEIIFLQDVMEDSLAKPPNKTPFELTDLNTISTASRIEDDIILGVGIVFSMQSDEKDEIGLVVHSFGFHIDPVSLEESGEIEYEVYVLKEEGYYADPIRGDFGVPERYDFRGEMNYWDLISRGTILEGELMPSSALSDLAELSFFQIPVENFESVHVPPRGGLRSFYITTTMTGTFVYLNPDNMNMTLNDEMPLANDTLEFAPKILVGEGVVSYPMEPVAYLYQPRSFLGNVYYKSGKLRPTNSSDPAALDAPGVIRTTDHYHKGVSTVMSGSYLVHSDSSTVSIYRQHTNQTFAHIQQLPFLANDRNPNVAIDKDVLVVGNYNRTHLFLQQNDHWVETAVLDESFDQVQLSGRNLVGAKENAIHSFVIEYCITQPIPTGQPSLSMAPSDPCYEIIVIVVQNPTPYDYEAGDNTYLWDVKNANGISMLPLEVTVDKNARKEYMCLPPGEYEFELYREHGPNYYNDFNGHYNLTTSSGELIFEDRVRVFEDGYIIPPELSKKFVLPFIPSPSFAPSLSARPSSSVAPSIKIWYNNGFEQGNSSFLGDHQWRTEGDGVWAITSERSNSGFYSIKSPNLAHRGSLPQISNATFTTIPEWGSGSLAFSVLACVSMPHDSLVIFVDGLAMDWISTTWPVLFERRQIELSSGLHTITFQYTYNPSGITNLPPRYSGDIGAVFIDEVFFSI